MELDRPGQSWHNYKFESDAGGRNIQTYSIEVAKESAQLSLIHLETLSAWCGTSGKVTSKDLLELYEKYQLWRQDLSKVIRNHSSVANGEDVLPFVLLLQYVSSSTTTECHLD